MTRYLALVFEVTDDDGTSDETLLAFGEHAAAWLELDGCCYSEVRVLHTTGMASPFPARLDNGNLPR